MNPEEKPDMHLGASPKIFRFAKQLRWDMTQAEQVLWEALRKKRLDGYRFRRQHPVQRYILDFYCHQLKLAIEVDGGYHQTEHQQEADQLRTGDLKAGNIRVIRFTNEEVLHKLNDVLDRIREEIERLK